jgi:hypothetical protein
LWAIKTGVQPYPRVNSAWKKIIKELEKYELSENGVSLKRKAKLQVFNTPKN